MRFRVVLALFMAFTALGFGAFERPVQNSFVNKRIGSVSELIAHAKADSQVRSRFTRHYAMEPDELYAYFRTFRIVRLARDETFTVYLVPASGEILVKERILKKGTAVFVDKDGTPVMIVSCGNPLGKPAPPIALNQSTVVERMTATMRPMAAEVPMITEESLLTSIVPPGLPEIIAIRPVEVVPPTVVTTGGEGSGSVLPVAGLAILPALFFVGGQGNGGAAPIPEPGTIFAISTGLAILALRRKSKRAR